MPSSVQITCGSGLLMRPIDIAESRIRPHSRNETLLMAKVRPLIGDHSAPDCLVEISRRRTQWPTLIFVPGSILDPDTSLEAIISALNTPPEMTILIMERPEAASLRAPFENTVCFLQLSIFHGGQSHHFNTLPIREFSLHLSYNGEK